MDKYTELFLGIKFHVSVSWEKKKKSTETGRIFFPALPEASSGQVHLARGNTPKGIL